MDLLTPLDELPPVESVLLIVDDVGRDDAKRRRDRRSQAILPVADIPSEEDLDALRVTMGWDGMGWRPVR